MFQDRGSFAADFRTLNNCPVGDLIAHRLEAGEDVGDPRPGKAAAQLRRAPYLQGKDAEPDMRLGRPGDNGTRLLHMITSLSCATFNPRRFVIEDFRKSNAPPGPRYWCFSKAR